MVEVWEVGVEPGRDVCGVWLHFFWYIEWYGYFKICCFVVMGDLLFVVFFFLEFYLFGDYFFVYNC